jgi:hypothetical protein
MNKDKNLGEIDGLNSTMNWIKSKDCDLSVKSFIENEIFGFEISNTKNV